MRSNIIKIAGLLVVVLLILLIAGVFGKNHVEEDYVVQLGYLPGTLGVNHFIALDQDLYEKNGVEIEATVFPSSNQLYDALAKGDIDAGLGLSSIPLLINELKDPGHVQIVTTSQINTKKVWDQIIVKKDSPVISLADLSGQRIGVFPGSTATTLLEEYLKTKNIDVSNIEYVQLPPSSQLQALEAGSIDVLFAYQPGVTIAGTLYDTRIIAESVFASLMHNNPTGTNTFSSQFVELHPKTADQLADTYDQAINFLENETNADEMARIANQHMGFDLEVAKELVFFDMAKSGETSQDHYNTYIDLLISLGELSGKPAIDNLFYQ